MTKTTAPNPMVAGKPRPVRMVFLVAALLVVLGVGFLGGPIRQWIATQAVLANDAPRLETLEELFTNARDPAHMVWRRGRPARLCIGRLPSDDWPYPKPSRRRCQRPSKPSCSPAPWIRI
jgi:hypothetical protein